MPDENKNARFEAAAPADGEPPAMSPARLAARLGRGLSALAADDNGWTDLHYAAALDWPATARALLAAGARRDARLRTDREPLGARLLSVLSACGQDRFRLLRRNGATPLHIAAVADACEAVAVLLEGGADPPAASPGRCATEGDAVTNAGEAAERARVRLRGARRAACSRWCRSAARQPGSVPAPDRGCDLAVGQRARHRRDLRREEGP